MRLDGYIKANNVIQYLQNLTVVFSVTVELECVYTTLLHKLSLISQSRECPVFTLFTSTCANPKQLICCGGSQEYAFFFYGSR